jgi:CDGSH-type Zn-finger protein
MADVKISVRPNGPLRVEGPFELLDPDGNAIPLPEGKTTFVLCRCGHSKTKPFCDATHREVGFDGTLTLA